MQGLFGKPDYAEALKWLTKAASRENHESEYFLGLMYQFGEGVTKDNATALTWYQKAADAGFPAAEVNLSGMYLFGQGVPVDNAKAFTLMESAANQGLALAQMNMSKFYSDGIGVPRDFDKAQAWRAKAAAGGYPTAVCEESLITLSGRPSDADRTKALAALQFNAKTGDGVCVNNLAWYLATTAGAKSEDLDQADQMLGQLMVKQPNQSQLLDTLAAVKAAEGDYAAAIGDEQKAIDALPANVDADGFRKDAAERIALFKAGKPYIAPPVIATTPAPIEATKGP